MKASILVAPDELVLQHKDIPDMLPGDVLIRVKVAAICGTDIRIYRGRKTAGVRYPSTLGHEFSGVIVDTGGHPTLASGDRVCLCPFIACGRCPLCKSRAENLCAAGTAIGYEIDGAFAEYIRIPEQAVAAGNLHKLPENVSFEAASLAEPLACVINGQNKVNVCSADTVVVFGAGPIGLLHVYLARMRGVRKLIACDPNAHKRVAATEAGADVVIDARQENMLTRIREETDGVGADVVICAIGKTELAHLATRVAAFGARISLFAGFSTGEQAELDVNDIHYRELTVTGAFGLSRQCFDQALDIITSGRLKLDTLITHAYTLDDIQQAFEMAESGQGIKVAIVDK